jgi:hypothetical protein
VVCHINGEPEVASGGKNETVTERAVEGRKQRMTEGRMTNGKMANVLKKDQR